MTIESRRGLAVASSILSVPLLYLVIFCGCVLCDHALASVEVTGFIRTHQELVARRLGDPKVHAFSLSPRSVDEMQGILLTPRSTLTTKRATNMRVENDLDDTWRMKSAILAVFVSGVCLGNTLSQPRSRPRRKPFIDKILS